MNIYKVYKITNLLTDKIYIGQTVKSIKHRFSQHIKNKKSYISKALNKYGPENFKIEGIASALSKNTINNLEEFFILNENSLAPNGYNLRTEGIKTLTSEIFSEVLRVDTQSRWDNILKSDRTLGFDARPIVGINNNLEIIEFSSITEAYSNKIYPDLSLKHPYYRAKGYYFFYRDEIDNETLINTVKEINSIKETKQLENNEKRRLALLESMSKDTDRFIVGVNPITNEILRYRNINHARLEGVAVSGLYYSLHPTEETITRWRGYHFFFEKDHTIEEMFELAKQRNELIHQRFLAGRKKAQANNQKNIDKQKVPIIGINPKTLEYKVFESISNAKNQGYSLGGIGPALRGQKRTSKGMHFQYYTKSIEEHIEIVKALYS